MNSIAIAAADGDDEQLLARDMIEVHGVEAAIVARDNARTAALTGQRPQARHWIRVLGVIQRRPNEDEIQISSQTMGDGEWTSPRQVKS
jgi:hypothetical protein